MDTQRIAEAPLNERGGQKSYLLLTEGQFGSKNLAVTWVEGVPGSEQPMHEHPDREQCYVIVQGRGLMRVGDEEREVSAGTLVFVPPATAHAIRNTGREPLIFVSAASPPFDIDTLSPEFRYQAQ